MRLRPFATTWPLAFLLVPLVSGPALAAVTPAMAGPVPPAAHHALYELSLQSAHGDDVSAAHGSMAYEVTDACDGWATRQRLDMTITNRDGQDVEMISDYATWESKDGLHLRFKMRQTTDTALTDQAEGSADLDRPGGAGTVHYSLPTKTEMALPNGTLFPMAHTEAILAAAASGHKFMAVPIFDGTGSKGAQDSSIVILDWKPPAPAPYPALASLPSGHVRVAFFERDKNQDSTPDYQVGMKYWANGVADDLHMDFNTFVMQGKLKQFALEKPHC